MHEVHKIAMQAILRQSRGGQQRLFEPVASLEICTYNVCPLRPPSTRLTASFAHFCVSPSTYTLLDYFSQIGTSLIYCKVMVYV